MATKKTPHLRQGGTALKAKRAKLVRLMLELAALDRDEYRRVRAELWQAAARSHERRPARDRRAWEARAS